MSENTLTAEQAASKPASKHTVEANARVKADLPFSDRRSFENAERGFIATLDPTDP